MKTTPASAAAAHHYGLPDEVTAAEVERVALRRAEAVRLGQISCADAEGVKGLALSGGGVRAAFVALGLLEKLAEHKVLAQFDYISSVSGGGYAACMLTDHVGNLRKNTVFGHGPYLKTAPPYSWAKMTAAILVDPLLHVLPLLAYVCLYLLYPFSAAGLKGYFPLLVCTFLIVALPLNQVWRWRSTNGTPPDTVRARVRNFLLLLLCFYAAAILTREEGTIATTCLIVGAMFVSGLWVRARPHRFHRRVNPAFPWLFAALLAVPAVNIVLQVTHPARDYLLLGLAAYGMIQAKHAGLASQNRSNYIFRFYRAALVARFMPFYRSLTRQRRLHDVEQSWNPYPIINASANFGATLEPFELTPLFCGSTASGYYRTADWLPELSLADAMTISGGAIDFLKRTATLRALLGTVMGGTHYWVPLHGGKHNRKAMLAVERLTVAAGGPPISAFRLSDGGFVENLGVLALIKRRARVIVCLDAAHDPNYDFEDLRQLCIMVQSLGLGQLLVEGLEAAGAQRRFRQNTSNVLTGTIHYPAVNGEASATGVFVLLKISAAGVPMQGQFPDFPHLTTLDQSLTEQEIGDLHRLGGAIGQELCAGPQYQVLMR